MTLSKGFKLGPYEILSPAGAGGMGEVYKARDTRLDRTVAIKVLPAHIVDDTTIRQRFDREARAISSLNHPHICILYDIGHQESIDYLVMEFLEGETLASRLAKGALAISVLLGLAVQIADALDKAHRQGLVHRDLKPSNIMLTKTGAKLMDFGLAKLQQTGDVVKETSGVTRTTPLTGEGTIVGTLQYMAPEQLEGKETDHRADIFAFGAVLYEMVTGRRPFEGSSQASLIASVLKERPRPLRELQSTSPSSLERVVEQCLAKDPDERWQSAGDLKRELAWILKDLQPDKENGTGSPVDFRSTGRLRLLLGISVVATLVFASALFQKYGRSAPASQEAQRFVVTTSSLESDFSTPPMISPDGRLIVYTDAGKLLLRELNQFDAEVIGKSEDLSGLFWSPDSRTIAFGQEKRLWRYDVATTDKRQVCTIPESGRILGGCWNKAGDIYLAVWRGSLYRTTEKGATPTLVISSDSVLVHDFHTPQFLPDGKTVLLYLHAKKDSDNGIGILREGQAPFVMIRKVPLAEGVTYSPSGHLLYTLAGDQSEIWALPFSAKDLRATGEPFMVIHGGQFPSVSHNGNVVYFGTQKAQEYRLIILSREAKHIDSIGTLARSISTPSFSPDGRYILYTAEDNGMWNLWKHDLIRGTSERLITDSIIAIRPSWFPSGDKFIFTHILGISQGRIDVFDLSLGKVTDSICNGMYGSLSPDGHTVVFCTDMQGNLDLWRTEIGKKSLPEPLLKTPSREQDAVISREGKWFAYESNASGRSQIYLRTFPDARSPLQVSVDGGWYPFWSRSGDSLYWVTDSSVYGVKVNLGQVVQLGIPEVVCNLATLGFKRNDRYSAAGENGVAISPDGSHLAAVIRSEAGADKSNLMVVLNWFSELEDRH